MAALLAGAVVLQPAGPALAEGGTGDYPFISGELAVEVQNDYAYTSDDPANELNDLFTDTEPTVVVHLSQEFSLTAHGVLEPVRDPGPGDDRVFADHGLFVEDLYATYEKPWVSVFGGKFTPNFGKAWDEAPGVYGTDIPEDYEFTERVGFGGTLTYAEKRFGEHTLEASTFLRDRTFLSESAFTDRGQTRLSDGGPGNTENLSSFSIAVDGSLPPLADFTYHLSYIRQAAGKGDTADEQGFVANLTHPGLNVGPISLVPLVEYVNFFEGAEGVKDQQKDYLTGAVTVEWESWNLALSYTGRNTNPKGGPDTEDFQFQVSAGYAWDLGDFGGLSFDVGWKTAQESKIDTDTVGGLLTYTIGF